MNDKTQSTHGLVSNVSSGHVDPAAKLDPAAPLDPAKVAPAPTAKPKRKRAPAKKRTAHKKTAAEAAGSKAKAKDFVAAASEQLSHAANAEQRAAYEAAQLHLVDGYALLPDNAELTLRLADGAAFLDGAVAVPREALQPQGDRVIYAKVIDVGPEGPPVRVTEAYLIASSGDCVRCEVGSGLSGGGGHHAQIPPGHLLF